MRDGTTPAFAVGTYTSEGIELRTVVRFHWRHSESRDELTDGPAIERLRNEDFGRRG